jgi:hypothetical protein
LLLQVAQVVGVAQALPRWAVAVVVQADTDPPFLVKILAEALPQRLP